MPHKQHSCAGRDAVAAFVRKQPAWPGPDYFVP